jgi:hypothetical protein
MVFVCSFIRDCDFRTDNNGAGGIAHEPDHRPGIGLSVQKAGAQQTDQHRNGHENFS